MKAFFPIMFWTAIGSPCALAMNVSWGSELFSEFRNSYGQPLDETFVIQLGFFEDALGTPFVPDADNVGEWAQRWRVFDEATLNLGLEYFTSESGITADGASTSPEADLGVNFTGQQAYLWIRNADAPVEGTEWFLATASEWVFPQGSDDCCDTTLPLQWSVSDLNPTQGNAVTPVWGGQSGNHGAGVFTVTSSTYTLQTFTVPEPSSIMVALTSSLLLLRRKRPNR